MLNIKEWFFNKNFTQNERYAISVADREEIIRETEKAVLVKWFTEFGNITRWIPRSCIYTEAELMAQHDEFLERQKGYDELIQQCRASGIPARKGWKASTMRQRLAVAKMKMEFAD